MSKSTTSLLARSDTVNPDPESEAPGDIQDNYSELLIATDEDSVTLTMRYLGNAVAWIIATEFLLSIQRTVNSVPRSFIFILPSLLVLSIRPQWQTHRRSSRMLLTNSLTAGRVCLGVSARKWIRGRRDFLGSLSSRNLLAQSTVRRL